MENEKKILRNIAKCLKCGDIIESTSGYDFVVCRCKSCFIDGGTDYVRFGGVNTFSGWTVKDIELLTEYADENH